MDGPRRDSAIAMGDEAQSSALKSVADLALSGSDFSGAATTQRETGINHAPEPTLDSPPDQIRPNEIYMSPIANANHYEIAAHVKSIYDFYVRIGVIDDTQMDFGPRKITHSSHEAYSNAGFDDDAIALLTVLPWPTRPINFDWNSPAVLWSKVPICESLEGRRNLPLYLSQNLKPSEIPLTEFEPGSLGFYWVIDAKTGMMRRIYLANPIEEEEPWVDDDEDHASTHEKQTSEGMDMEGGAVELLSEYLGRLESLETIPLRLWAESNVKPGFVDKTESVYEDVKAKLYAYGWPSTFRREQWVRDLPVLVARWKIQKVAYLESTEERTAL